MIYLCLTGKLPDRVTVLLFTRNTHTKAAEAVDKDEENHVLLDIKQNLATSCKMTLEIHWMTAQNIGNPQRYGRKGWRG